MIIISTIFYVFDQMIYKCSGFHLNSIEDLLTFMYRPTDPSSLGVTRMLFGIMMMLDCTSERGGGDMDLRWGEPRICHFPLFPQLQPLSFPYMALVYGIMCLGALGIALGYKFKFSAIMFASCYWYILLLDKSFWNNHSYLFGLISLLMIGTNANNHLSLDAYYNKSISDVPVPYWNYFILKYQFFILYFVAGLKKGNYEWLSGYAMRDLSKHWVFYPLTLFFGGNLTDYLFVHWFAFLFDLTVCFWMMYGKTRPVAMLFCAMFHLMNSRLFTIGMFPWVCLATMPLFCPANWPKLLEAFVRKHFIFFNKNQTAEDKKQLAINENNEELTTKQNNDSRAKTPKTCVDKDDPEIKDKTITHGKKKKIVLLLIFIYMAIQGFLPYSHFITKGFNNWTNGLYGYSWDMMVHSWDTISVSVKVVDNESKKEMFLDPEAYTLNDRWSKHGDMVYQYAHCLYKNMLNDIENPPQYKIKASKEKKYNIIYDTVPEDEEIKSKPKNMMSKNVSIYVDVWCSMNGRFQQRMFDPTIDLLKAEWSPFENIPWLKPLLTEFSNSRQKMDEMQEHVYSWNNYSEVLFIADFPGLELENFVVKDLSNVTITVLEGQIYVEMVPKSQNNKSYLQTEATHLTKGDSLRIKAGLFHKIHTAGSSPSTYMYTYINATKKALVEKGEFVEELELKPDVQPKLPLKKELFSRMKNIGYFLQHVGNALLYIIYGVPMTRRIPA